MGICNNVVTIINLTSKNYLETRVFKIGGGRRGEDREATMYWTVNTDVNSILMFTCMCAYQLYVIVLTDL